MSTPTRAYTPDPGTTPDRALSWLRSQPLGTEVSTSALAAGAGVPHGGLTVAMQPALKAKLVFARQKGGHLRSPLFWSLVDHQKLRAFIASTTPGSDGKPEADEDRPVQRTIPAAGAPPLPIAPPLFPPLPKGLRADPVVRVEKPGPRGSAAEPRNDNDDNESDSGRARRLAGGSDDGGSRADRGGDGRARDGVDDRGAAARGAVLLRAQPPRAAHQGTAGAAAGGAVASAVGDDLTPEGRDSQHVLKAEAARPDATDREIHSDASPVGGPTGAGQAAAAAPAGDLDAPLVGRTATISMTGEVAIVAECGTVILFDAQRGRQLVQWLAGRVE